MLTPQEVSERAFQKANFGGYNMAQVDEFLDILTGDYSALYNENAVLKNKLMAAQRMADDLVKEAERKKADMLAQVERESRERVAAIEQDIQAEEYRLKQAQQETASFVEKVRALHAKEAEYLARLEDLYPPETKPHQESLDEKASEIDDNVQRLLAQAMEAATAENMRSRAEEGGQDLSDTAEFTPGAAPEEDYDQEDAQAYEEDREDGGEGRRSSGGRIDFGSLQFGRDYEIT